MYTLVIAFFLVNSNGVSVYSNEIKIISGSAEACNSAKAQAMKDFSGNIEVVADLSRYASGVTVRASCLKTS